MLESKWLPETLQIIVLRRVITSVEWLGWSLSCPSKVTLFELMSWSHLNLSLFSPPLSTWSLFAFVSLHFLSSLWHSYRGSPQSPVSREKSSPVMVMTEFPLGKDCRVPRPSDLMLDGSQYGHEGITEFIERLVGVVVSSGLWWTRNVVFHIEDVVVSPRLLSLLHTNLPTCVVPEMVLRYGFVSRLDVTPQTFLLSPQTFLPRRCSSNVSSVSFHGVIKTQIRSWPVLGTVWN